MRHRKNNADEILDRFLKRLGDPGASTHDLVIPLTPAAVVEGLVLDEVGEPMQGVFFHFFRAGANGQAMKIPAGPRNVVTDDQGHFRAFRFEPGSYYIAVEAFRKPNHVLIVPTPPHVPRNPEETYVMTYYPGTADADQAFPVQLQSGENVLKDIRVIAQ